MHTCQTNLEDADNHRQIDLTVTYVAAGEKVELKQVTPTRITFLCPESRRPLRSIALHREMARSMLLAQIDGHMEQLRLDVEAQHASLA